MATGVSPAEVGGGGMEMLQAQMEPRRPVPCGPVTPTRPPNPVFQAPA